MGRLPMLYYMKRVFYIFMEKLDKISHVFYETSYTYHILYIQTVIQTYSKERFPNFLNNSS